MENEMMASRNFLIVGYDIFKTLNLNREHRKVNGKVYLDEIYQDYIKIIENSKLVHSKKIKDALAPVPDAFKVSNSSASSPNSSDIGLELHSV
jgi:hypothetical protein